MLNSHELGLVLCSDHEWEESVRSNTACVLATNVKEDWSLILIEVLVVDPIPLLVCSLVLIVEVVNRIINP